MSDRPTRHYRQGSVYQRKDGRWVAELAWPDGTRKYRYTHTQAAAQKELRALRKLREEGAEAPDDRYTVGQLLQDWLQIMERSVRPSTYTSYEVISRLHLTPVIGRVRLARLHPSDIERCIERARTNGLGDRMVQYVHATIRAALSEAVRQQIVTRNVAKLVRTPRVDRAQITAPTVDRARAILQAVQEDRLSALYAVAMMGLRRGEILGLRWQDVDLDQAVLRVVYQIQRQKSGLVMSEPKTRSSRRAVPLPAFVVTALRAHRAQQLEERLLAGSRWSGEHDLVFTTAIGTPVDPNNLTHQFQRLIAAANLPPMRFHDLRHAAASLLRAHGQDLKSIQVILGHSTYHLTADTYSSVFVEELRAAADTMDRILGAG